ncbi:hypothetical protein LGX91_09220, partial [Lactiplantibacillus plantarum]|nr:hypothetical protein [Lactiplantibacillus plantarum]MCZ2274896.1 hypothetical protein [Lactiplantibacillus plantarum]
IKNRSGKIRRFFQTCFVSRDLCHSLEVLIIEYQRDGLNFDLTQCWGKPAEYFIDLEQARQGLQTEVSA